MKKVVITGLGCFNALGKNKKSYWENLEKGVSGIRPIKDRWTRIYKYYDEEQTPWIGGEIQGYDPDEYFSKRELFLLDPVSQFTLIAAEEAIRDANLDLSKIDRTRTSIILGTSTGGDESRDEASYKFFKEKKRISNFTIIRSMDSAPTSHLSIKYNITGPCYTVQSACASSTQSIAQSYLMIKSGLVDYAISGGTENLPSLGLFKAWEAMRILAPDNCKPFSKNRKGLVLGEGAGILILESLESAQKRGAFIYGEIIGCSMSSDASNIVAPSQKGAEQAMSIALKSAGIASNDVDYINAHGTGTLLNDKTEVAAIKSVFGASKSKYAVSSTKSSHGHGLGATGAFEAMACLFALNKNIIPPTINYEIFDETCDINLVANTARHKDVNIAMTNSFGFGGSNGVLLFKKN